MRYTLPGTSMSPGTSYLDLHGFELMMAPYSIAHLKLGLTTQGNRLRIWVR